MVDLGALCQPGRSAVQIPPGHHGEGLTPGLGFQVATPNAIRDKRPELEDFVRRLAAARAWSAGNVSSYAETWGKLMNIPTSVPLNWLTRAKIRITPIDDGCHRG